MRISSFFFASFLIFMLSPTAESYSTANLSTTWIMDYSFRGIVGRLVLNVTEFSCGFFCEDTSCTSYIFAIFITVPSDPRQYKVVWSANQDNPVRIDAKLNFTATGELVLSDVDGSIVWTTNTAGKSVAGMNLTDTGNLVLFDDNNSVVWQSFDHPTDCLLPGQMLSQDQKFTSKVYLTNYSTILKGTYSLQLTDSGLSANVESYTPQAYYDYVFINYNNTIDGRRYMRFLNGSLSFFINSSKTGSPYGEIDIPQASSAQYMKLMSDGRLKVFEWQSEDWKEIIDFTSYISECSYPLVCGRNSICLANQQCICPKTEYFRLVNDREPTWGCSEITPITCNSTKDQHLIKLDYVDYFTSTPDMGDVSIETCKQACLSNCSCKGAFFQYSNASSGMCFLASEIFTMKALDSNSYNNALAFIKVQNATSQPSPNQVTTIVGSTIGSFMILVVLVIGFIMYIVHKNKRDAKLEDEYLDQLLGMPTRFSYEELKTATRNFSKKLGQGGFGSVFEGSLKDGSMIAVKCLEGISRAKKSFLAEVQSIGSIHHVNLVRLRGFCTWKSQRFLVYDFMSNGSLDRWIYYENQDNILDWECRKKIILDIAKGLAYLHEECRQKIIHLDIKPQNILLDDDFNAKVSDFGLSKLIDRDQKQVMTIMRGTPGYLAPEWLSSIITEKVDVYSFGIVLLEILCGRKNFDRSQPEEKWHLLRFFQKCLEEETLLVMIDMNSNNMQTNGTQVVEVMKLASWCLQTDYTRRPSMSLVVKVLEGGMNVESNLDYNLTDPIKRNNSQEKNVTPLMPYVLSGPR